MYTDMYKTFENEQISYSYPFSFQNNRTEYMKSTDIPTYEMDFGDTTTFPFKVDSKYQGWIINILVYNFRYEQVYVYSDYLDELDQIYLDIDQDLSADIFIQGLYYIQLKAFLPLEDGTYKVVTILPKEECSIRVR